MSSPGFFSPGCLSLQFDVLYYIAEYLSVTDFVALLRTCRTVHSGDWQPTWRHFTHRDRRGAPLKRRYSDWKRKYATTYRALLKNRIKAAVACNEDKLRRSVWYYYSCYKNLLEAKSLAERDLEENRLREKDHFPFKAGHESIYKSIYMNAQQSVVEAERSLKEKELECEKFKRAWQCSRAKLNDRKRLGALIYSYDVDYAWLGSRKNFVLKD